MAGYNPNGNENKYYGNEYINFDQFLMQHNINNSTPHLNASPGFAYNGYDLNEVVNPIAYYNPPTMHNQNISTDEFQQQYSLPLSRLPNDGQGELAQNSNLLPTATEFVPHLSNLSENSTLFAGSVEFVPKKSSPRCKNNDRDSMLPQLTFSIDSKQANDNSCDYWDNGRAQEVGKNDLRSELQPNDNQDGGRVKRKEVPKSDLILRALINTHISDKENSKANASELSLNALYKPRDGENSKSNRSDVMKSNALAKTRIPDGENSQSKPLTSAGGAIKKVKNQNYRNDSRERSAYANRNGNKQQAENGVYIGRCNDRRRMDVRKNESRHYGTGRTASQYDNSDRYNNRNEYFSEKYKDNNQSLASPSNSRKQHRHNNSLNQNLDTENGSKASNNNLKYKDKKYAEASNRKSDEPPKGSRNSKSQNFKFNNIKVDLMNYSQREKLIREIDVGKLECLVCCEMIKPFQSVWSCSNCYHIIHLSCVIKWAASSKSDEGWRCCACQNITKNVPHEYFCFCGKLRNPVYNRNDVAHSCGDSCGKTDGCVHPCTQLCHPGPCPPCQAMVTRTCGCGRTQKMFQCSQKDDLECDQLCGKELNCSAHKCERKCHSGGCDECDKEIEHVCYCTREKKTLPCTKQNNESLTYSCANVCNKQLQCKNHKCKDLCHPGDCGDCKLLPDVITCCPCGKMPITADQRTSCKDPIPLCGGNCKKPLSCGQPAHPHTCISKCHTGSCPPCNKQTSVKCRCGHMDQMIKCNLLSTRADDARCKKRCTRKRSCGKHKCNQECCIDIDHQCPLKCSYNLSCGKHKCESTCHKGRCLPCYRSSFDELHCECGANVIYPPVPCGTKRPACDKPCSRSHACDHPVTHNCHSAQNCPPCMAFTTKYCHGKHEQRKIIPCSQDDFSCGLACNKPLKCGQHKCIKVCHSGPCELETDMCKQNCTKLRVMCPHNCNAPCHLNSICPDTPCRESVEVLCQCGLRKQTRTCHDFASDYRKIATSQLASSMQQMQSGTTVELSDVLGPIKMTNNKTLECTEECRLQERNRRLAVGLQIRNPDLPSKLQPKYSEFIRSWAKKDSKLVHMIHDKLTELVKLAKESKQKSRSYSFPTMNREKRQLVHEMCAMFGVESVAYDAEPNRNVVASATRDTSWLPGMSIMELIQRESGQRRIPVPSLNAWGMKR